MNKIYVGGGFSPQVIPLFDSYLISNRYRVFTNEDISEYFRGPVNYFDMRLFKIISYITVFWLYLFVSVPLTFFGYRSSRHLVRHFVHSYIDACNVRSKNIAGKIELIEKFEVLREIFNAILLSLYVKYFLGIDKVIMGHNVYGWRMFNACSNLMGTSVVLYANWNFHKFNFSKDTAWWDISDLSKYKALSNMVINEYFDKRITGNGVYEDSNNMYAKASRSRLDLPSNVIFLHIYRDSPFNVVDRGRIFRDYFDWIEQTIRIVSNSRENWSLRLHPSADRWGEDNKRITEHILQLNGSPSNIIIEESSDRSVYDLLSTRGRIVTFNGTIQIEALCFGIMPIVISDSMGARYVPENVLKPVSSKNYRDLLLMPKDAFNKEYNSDEHIEIGKRLLFYRECVANLKSKLNIPYLYRGDTTKQIGYSYNKACEARTKIEEYVHPMLKEHGI